MHPELSSPLNHEPASEAIARPSFFIPLAPPYVTRVLIGLNLLAFVAAVVGEFYLFGTFFNDTNYSSILLIFGMKWNRLILEGQIWRLFTAMFLHIGPIHLLSNIIGLLMLGPIIEGHFGHWRFTVIYLLGGLLGSIASFAFSPSPSAGASGAIFALLGATVLYFYRFRENFGQRGREILQSMLVVLVLNLAIGFGSSGVDNWGHMGGLVGGVLITLGMMPHYRLPTAIVPGRQPLVRDPRLMPHLAWTGLYAGLLVVAFWLSSQISPVLF